MDPAINHNHNHKDLHKTSVNEKIGTYIVVASEEIFWTWLIKVLVFPSPTGYMHNFIQMSDQVGWGQEEYVM
jgi:hypothetical protein